MLRCFAATEKTSRRFIAIYASISWAQGCQNELMLLINCVITINSVVPLNYSAKRFKVKLQFTDINIPAPHARSPITEIRIIRFDSILF